MNCGNRFVPQALLCFFFLFAHSSFLKAEEFSFKLEEIEKKPLTWGGYAEIQWDHMDIRQGSAFSFLNLPQDRPASLDRFSGALQLDGNYVKGAASIYWLLQASAQEDNLGSEDMADVYEAYATIKPGPQATGSLGKKSYKWGKGYAWNPVGFINRRKDPNNPDESLEGYITAETDLIKSFDGTLQTAALTAVVLPVWQGVNEDFGSQDEVNLAAKLYFLFLNTDIDFLFLSAPSRADAIGLDFSKNLATNFEIHGEAAWTWNQPKITLLENGSLSNESDDVLSWLFGIRYLSQNDITSIIEYYHNDAGYSEEEMERFYRFIGETEEQLNQTKQNALLQRAREISLRGYGRPQPGRDYLYGRFSWKEPFDILYFTPALTTILNLDDSSFTLTPELIYTGFTNLEIRLRFAMLGGGTFSEYGEKQNSNRLELRLRYFF